MRALLVVIVLFAAISFPACVPLPTNDACRQRVNDCLAACPVGVDTPRRESSWEGGDSRSSCEAKCHERCY